MEQSAPTPAGWYADPTATAAGSLRWWDGAEWSEHVHVPETQSPPAASVPTAAPALPVVHQLQQVQQQRQQAQAAPALQHVTGGPHVAGRPYQDVRSAGVPVKNAFMSECLIDPDRGFNVMPAATIVSSGTATHRGSSGSSLSRILTAVFLICGAAGAAYYWYFLR